VLVHPHLSGYDTKYFQNGRLSPRKVETLSRSAVNIHTTRRPSLKKVTGNLLNINLYLVSRSPILDVAGRSVLQAKIGGSNEDSLAIDTTTSETSKTPSKHGKSPLHPNQKSPNKSRNSFQKGKAAPAGSSKAPPKRPVWEVKPTPKTKPAAEKKPVTHKRPVLEPRLEIEPDDEGKTAWRMGKRPTHSITLPPSFNAKTIKNESRNTFLGRHESAAIPMVAYVMEFTGAYIATGISQRAICLNFYGSNQNVKRAVNEIELWIKETRFEREAKATAFAKLKTHDEKEEKKLAKELNAQQFKRSMPTHIEFRFEVRPAFSRISWSLKRSASD
jgi:hypothetical protein